MNLMQVFRNFFVLIFLSSLVFSQVVIQDTVDVGKTPSGSNILADDESPVQTSAYSITVSLNWSGIKTNYPKITLKLSGRDNVMLNCTNYCFGSGPLQTTVDTSFTSSFSIEYKDNNNTQLTITTTLISLPIDRLNEPYVIQKHEIWFYYSNIQQSFKAGTVTVTKTTQGVPPTLQYHCFSQVDPQWGSDIYDHDSSANMTNWGCALACMAMILKSYGIDTDPGRLNDSMKANNGFDGRSVKWDFIDDDPRNTFIKYGGQGGESNSPKTWTS